MSQEIDGDHVLIGDLCAQRSHTKRDLKEAAGRAYETIRMKVKWMVEQGYLTDEPKPGTNARIHTMTEKGKEAAQEWRSEKASSQADAIQVEGDIRFQRDGERFLDGHRIRLQELLTL